MNRSFNTFSDVEGFLNSIPKFSTSGVAAADFGLGKMEKFCDAIGNPQNTFPSIHVAGTNGKGTVCRMLASVYQLAGYKTGLYTSPHLLALNERFKVNGLDISDDDLILFFKKYGKKVIDESLTYFEITTVIAFWFFSKENVDIAMVETGLGGRLDATNIIKPVASVITSIGLDHTDLLGNTLTNIAFEKAGIIKKRVPVIVGDLPAEACEEISRITNHRKSERVDAEKWQSNVQNDILTIESKKENLILHLPNRKKVDAVNVSIVHSIIKTLEDYFPVGYEQFVNGIESLDHRFPNHAQFERLSEHRDWYFDGAHNLNATSELINHLFEKAAPEKWTVVLSFMKDKLNSDLEKLWNQFPELHVFEMEGKRAATINEMKHLFPHAKELNKDFFLRENSQNQFKSELVIFSGSFYFYSIVKRWMGTRAIHVD